MDTSKFLAKVVGLYLIIVSIMMAMNTQQFTTTVSALINDAPLMLVTGFCTLIIGLLMVVSHNIWQWNWRVLVTLIAWIVLLKAIGILLFPQVMDKTTVLFVQTHDAAYVAAGVDLVLGLVIGYFGFRR